MERVNGAAVEFLRRDRTTSAIWHPEVYSVYDCSRPDVAECGSPCTGNQSSPILGMTGRCDGFGIAGNITSNCTCLFADGYWSDNITDAVMEIPAGASISFELDDVRNPPYSGIIGNQSLTTLLPNSRGVNGIALPIPAILPGTMSGAEIELSSPRPATAGQMTLRFTLQNPLPADGWIEVLFPPGFTFDRVGTADSFASATFNVNSLVVGDGNITVFQEASGDTTGAIEFTVGEITSRKGTAGPSGDFEISTRRLSVDGEIREIDRAIVNPPLSTAEFLGILPAAAPAATIVDVATGVAPPLVGSQVKIKLEFTLRQAVDFPAGIFEVTFGEGIVLPDDPADLEIEFYPLAPGQNEYFPDATASIDESVITIERRTWSLLQTPDGRAVPEGTPVQIEIRGAFASASERPVGDIRIASLNLTAGRVEVDASIIPSPDTVSPCELADVSISLATLVAGEGGFSHDDLTMSFSTCRDMAAGDIVELRFPVGIVQCPAPDCGADLRSSFSVPFVTGLVLGGNNASNFGLPEVKVYEDVAGLSFTAASARPAGSTFSLQLKGVRNPILQLSQYSGDFTLNVRSSVDTLSFQRKALSAASVGALTLISSINAPHTVGSLSPPTSGDTSTLEVLFILSTDITDGAVISFVVQPPPGTKNNALNLTGATAVRLISAAGDVIFEEFRNGTNMTYPQTDDAFNATLTLNTDILTGSLVLIQVDGVQNPVYATETTSVTFNVFPKVLDLSSEVMTKTFASLTVIAAPIVNPVMLATPSTASAEDITAIIAFTTSGDLPADGKIFISLSGFSGTLAATTAEATEETTRDGEIAVTSGDTEHTMLLTGGLTLTSVTGGLLVERAGDKTWSYKIVVDCHSSRSTSECLALDCDEGSGLMSNCSLQRDYTSSPSVVPAGSRVAIKLNKLVSRNRGGPTTVTVKTLLASDDVIDSTVGAVGPVLDPAPTSGSVALVPQTAGAAAEVSISFVVAHEIPDGGSIMVEFPLGYGGYGSTAGISNITNVQIDGVDRPLAFMTSNAGGVINVSTFFGEAVAAGSVFSFGLVGTIRAPQAAAPNTPVLVTSLDQEGRSIDQAPAIDNTVRNTIGTVSVEPRFSYFRAGLSLDTQEDNNAQFTFVVANPIPNNGRIFVKFPGEFDVSNDAGCTGETLVHCVSSAECISGCTGGLTIVNVTRDSPQMANFSNVTLEIARDGDGFTVPADTSVVLQVNGFSIPRTIGLLPGNVTSTTSGAFVITTASEDGRAADTGVADGITFTTPPFQSAPVWNVASSWDARSIETGCNVAGPAFQFSDTNAGGNGYLEVVSFRATSAMPANSTLVFELPAATHSTTAENMIGTVSICPTDADRASKDASCQAANVTVTVGVRTGALPADPDMITLEMSFPFAVRHDQIVDVFGIGKGSSGFTHRPTSGLLGTYRLRSSFEDSILDDSPAIEPYYCYNGALHRYILQENVVYPDGDTLRLSPKQTGAISTLSFPGLQLAVPIEEGDSVRVYFPPGFDLENLTLVGSGFVVDSLFTAPASAPATNPPTVFSAADRPAVQIRALRSHSTLNGLRLEKLRNPFYALGYPPDLNVPPPLVVKTTSIESGSPRESIMYQAVIVPLLLENVELGQMDTSAARIVAVDVSFSLGLPLESDSELHIRLPPGVAADRPSGGFEVTNNVTVKLTENSYIGGGDFVIETRTASVGNVSAYFAAPYTCSDERGDYCADSFDSALCPVGSDCTSATSHYSPSFLVLTRTSRILQGTFVVPSTLNATHGHACDIREPIDGLLPGSLVQPEDCDIDGTKFNTTAKLQYVQHPGRVNPDSIISFSLQGIRNPVRAGELPGDFDIEIWNPHFGGGLRLVARHHAITSQSITGGEIVVKHLSLEDPSVGGTTQMRIDIEHSGLFMSGSNISFTIAADFTMSSSITYAIVVTCPVVDCSTVIANASILAGVENSTIEVLLGENAGGAWKDYGVSISANFSSVTNPEAGGPRPMVLQVASRAAGTSGEILATTRADNYPVDIDPRLGAATPTVTVLPDESGAEVYLKVEFTPSTAVPAAGGVTVQLPAKFGVPTRFSSASPWSPAFAAVEAVDPTQDAGRALATAVLEQTGDVIVLTMKYATTTTSPFMKSGVPYVVTVGNLTTAVGQPPLDIGTLIVRTVTDSSVPASTYSQIWTNPLSWYDAVSGARAIDQASSDPVLLNAVAELSALGEFLVTTPVVGKFSSANVSFVTNVAVSSTSRIVVQFPGMSTCTEGYGASGNSIVQHLEIFAIHVFNADGTYVQEATAVTNVKQVPATDTDGFCASNPTTTCYSRCKAIDSNYGSLGPYSDLFEMMPGVDIPANKRIVIMLKMLRMPSVIGLTQPLTVKIVRDAIECSAIQISIGGAGTCVLDSGTFGAFAVVSANMTSSNARVTPRDLSVSKNTEYNILFFSDAGVPKDGAIKITLPKGTQAPNARVSGAAITGKVRTFSGKNVFLKSPASSQDDFYTGTSLSVMLTEKCNIEAKRAHLEPDGGTTVVTTITFPSNVWACHAEKKQIITSYQSINPDFGHRAGAENEWGLANANYRYALENVDDGTAISTATNPDGTIEVTVSNFRYDFPPFTLINITLGNIVNGPIAGVQTDPYTVHTYASTDSLEPMETTSQVAGSLLNARSVDAVIKYDSVGAHAKGGCLLALDVASDIPANSTLELQFSDLFAAANTLTSVRMATASELAGVTFSTGTPLTAFNLAVDVVQSAASNRKVVVVLREAIPRGNTLALKFVGQLRNPRRPGASGYNSFVILDPMGRPQLSQSQIIQTIITSGELEQASISTQYDLVGLRTWLRFTYNSPSEVKTTDYFTVKVPSAYSFTVHPQISNGNVESYEYRAVVPAPDRAQDLDKLPALNVIGAVSGVPDTFGVTDIDNDIVTVKRCTDVSAGPDKNVSFALGPFLNRAYGSQNYLGAYNAAGIFEVLLRDVGGTVIEGSNLTIAPPLMPQYLKEVAVESTEKRSAEITNLTISFRTSTPVPAGGELHVYLPDGFVILQQPMATFHLTIQGSTQQTLHGDLAGDRREDASDPTGLKYRVVLRLVVSQPVAADSTAVLKLYGVLNPVGGESAGTVPLPRYYINTATPACRSPRVPAKDCMSLIDSNYGDIVSHRVLPGTLIQPEVRLSTNSAGNNVMLSVSFRTSNPLPFNTSIEIILPEGYVADADATYCSDVLNNSGVCLAGCTETGENCPVGLNMESVLVSATLVGNRSVVTVRHVGESEIASLSLSSFFPDLSKEGTPPFINKLLTPGYSGHTVLFNVSSIRVRQSSGGGGLFQILTRDSYGRIVDDSGLIDSSDLEPNGLQTASVKPLSLAAASKTSVAVRFKTFNPIPSDGKVVVQFPSGYALDGAFIAMLRSSAAVEPDDLSAAYGMDGNATLSVEGQSAVLARDGSGSVVPSQQFVDLYIANVTNSPRVGLTDPFVLATDAW